MTKDERRMEGRLLACFSSSIIIIITTFFSFLFFLDVFRHDWPRRLFAG